VATKCDPGTTTALKKALGGADLYFTKFGVVEAPIVLGAGRTGISALALLGEGGAAPLTRRRGRRDSGILLAWVKGWGAIYTCGFIKAAMALLAAAVRCI